MTHEQQRIWLIQELQKEPSQFSRYQIPRDERGQKDLLRALMNIWQPKPLRDEFLQMQDAYLTEENRREGITALAELTPLDADPTLYLWQGDMTTLRVDAIVNPANSALLGCFRPLHGCADNLVHSKAGLALRYRCYEIMQAQGHEEPTGQAKITPAYNLPCKYVIHTVGPIVDGALTQEHCRLLASSYRACLTIAEENQCESIALCGISTGVFGFPKEEAAEIAIRTVKDFKADGTHPIKVIFNVFSDTSLAVYRETLQTQA